MPLGGGGRRSRAGPIEKLLAQSHEKALDLSDSDYFLIAPTSADFSLLERLISTDLGRIRAAVFVNDGLNGEGFSTFREKLAIVTYGRITEISLSRLDQLEVISQLSEAVVLKESGMEGLIVCCGFLTIPLFHLALYLGARAIELTDSGYRELITYPTWKLNDISLAILYVVRRLEELDEKATPHAIVRFVKIKSKIKRKGNERSKLVSLDYYLKKYLIKDGLVVKDRDSGSKRGVVYRLTAKGRMVAQLVEAHFLTTGVNLGDVVDLESLNGSTEVPIKD